MFSYNKDRNQIYWWLHNVRNKSLKTVITFSTQSSIYRATRKFNESKCETWRFRNICISCSACDNRHHVLQFNVFSVTLNIMPFVYDVALVTLNNLEFVLSLRGRYILDYRARSVLVKWLLCKLNNISILN